MEACDTVVKGGWLKFFQNNIKVNPIVKLFNDGWCIILVSAEKNRLEE